MKNITITIAILALLAAPLCAATEPARPGILLVFPALAGEKDSSGDLSVTAEVVKQLRKSTKATVVVYQPDLPSVMRGLMERRLSAMELQSTWDVRTALKIAVVAGASHAVQLFCSIDKTEVKASVFYQTIQGISQSFEVTSPLADQKGRYTSGQRKKAIASVAEQASSQIADLVSGKSKTEEANPPAPPVSAAAEPASLEPSPGTPAPAPETGTAAQPSLPAPASREVVEQKPVRDLAGQYIVLSEEADKYEAARDFTNSAAVRRRAVDINPRSAEARVKLSNAYAQAGMVEKAIEECKRAVDVVDDKPAVYRELSRLYLLQGNASEAADATAALVKLDPSNPESHLVLGDAYWNSGKVDEATAEFEEAVRLQPDNKKAHERLSRLLNARKLYLPAFEEKLRLNLLEASVKGEDAGAYKIAAQLVKSECEATLNRLRVGKEDLDSDKIARDDYYTECRDSMARADALAKLLKAQRVPEQYRQAHAHAALAASLTAQASGELVTYLETEKFRYLDSAETLQSEASAELALLTQELEKG